MSGISERAMLEIDYYIDAKFPRGCKHRVAQYQLGRVCMSFSITAARGSRSGRIAGSVGWRDVRFGSKADICNAKRHVRFPRKRTPSALNCAFQLIRKYDFLHELRALLLRQCPRALQSKRKIHHLGCL